MTGVFLLSNGNKFNKDSFKKVQRLEMLKIVFLAFPSVFFLECMENTSLDMFEVFENEQQMPRIAKYLPVISTYVIVNKLIKLCCDTVLAGMVCNLCNM